MSVNNQAEARRQIEICNACRYCEGFCAVFPAMTKQRTFSLTDMTQFANLCHNCQGCYHACQYTAPHEFAINLPAALAEVRTASWERLSTPTWLAKRVQTHGGLVAGLVLFATIFFLMWMQGVVGGNTFYDYFSHNALVAIFAPAFVGPLVVIAWSIRRYWREVGGETVRWSHLVSALKAAANLKNLSGGQQQGCQYEDGDRYSHKRRAGHQLAMYGFLLCFASTSTATVMHYVLDMPAPYAWYTLPKILGVIGGVMLSVGALFLMKLKRTANPELGSASRWGGTGSSFGCCS